LWSIIPDRAPTRKIAEALSEALACDLEEIVEDKSQAGSFGYIRSLVEPGESVLQ